MLIVFAGLIGFIGTPVEPPVESGLSQMQSFSPRLLVMGSRGSANGKVRRRGFRPTGNYRLGDVRNADLPSAALATKDASGIRDEQVVDRSLVNFEPVLHCWHDASQHVVVAHTSKPLQLALEPHVL